MKKIIVSLAFLVSFSPALLFASRKISSDEKLIGGGYEHISGIVTMLSYNSVNDTYRVNLAGRSQVLEAEEKDIACLQFSVSENKPIRLIITIDGTIDFCEKK